MTATRRFGVLLTLLVMLTGGCRRDEVANVPLLARLIGIADRFYDVYALDAERIFVVGYAGKILATNDGGFSWRQVPSGTTRALYKIRFVDDKQGWICGQEGTMLHTSDGGQTWERQTTGTDTYLFSLTFLDAQRGWAIGDKAILVETKDGGTHWNVRKITPPSRKNLTNEEAVASQDPVLYDLYFRDADNGWVVGEFGSIYHTSDGGQSWSEQQASLIGAEVVDLLDLPTFFGVNFLDAQNGLVSGLDGKIARTKNGGETWAFEPLQLDYPIIDPLYTPRLFADGNGWAIGAAGEVLHRAPGAAAWKREKLGMEVVTWLRGMYWHDANDGWIVGGLGLILHTKDGGKTWTPSFG